MNTFMRAFTMALSIVPVFLCAELSRAQNLPNYTRDAEIQRTDGKVSVVSIYPRPLQQVLDAVTQEYGWAIDYEDPPYQSSLELVDATHPNWRAAHPDSPGVMNIRGGLFRTTYPESESTAVSTMEQARVIRQVVADYNASGNPGQFAVRDTAQGRLEIVGISVKDESGAQMPAAPILDTPIHVQAGSMRLDDAISAMLREVSRMTGTDVGFASGPTNLMIQTTVTLSGAEMPARDALREVLSQAKIHLYWRLLYDAGYKAYFFNVVIATRAEYDEFGKRHTEILRKDDRPRRR